VAKGTVSKKQRANGLTWIYRFQTTRSTDGARVENTKVIGLVKEIGKSEKAAWEEVGRLGLDNNLDQSLGDTPTFRELAEHFRLHELRRDGIIGHKSEETVWRDEHNLDGYAIPRWGDEIAMDIKPLEIERWFEALATDAENPLMWPTIDKIRSIISQVFRHAQRHGLIPAGETPIALARCKTTSVYEAKVVTPEQMIVILSELDATENRCEWTLALLHAATALRPEEAFGLQWLDPDWKNNRILIQRAWSKGKITPGKNPQSMTSVPMHPALAFYLQEWRRESRYAQDSDWIFPSYKAAGRIPRSASICGKDYLRPAAVKAGVLAEDDSTRFGWHNLRHSLATFFAANEVSLSVIQSVLRHAKPSTTAIYTHRVDSAQKRHKASFLKPSRLRRRLTELPWVESWVEQLVRRELEPG
jgi:integrase